MQVQDLDKSDKAYSDFAGLLASLAEARPRELPTWFDDDSPPDVATLSYEQALKSHARYRSVDDFSGNIFTAAAECDRAVESAGSADADEQPSKNCGHNPEEFKPSSLLFAEERNRKCASVTIRMSKAESDQLRDRATKAGMTISAYLRSCTFEAESLRAQVKQALAELRKAQAAHGKDRQGNRAGKTKSNKGGTCGPWYGWLLRFMPELNSGRSPVRA